MLLDYWRSHLSVRNFTSIPRVLRFYHKYMLNFTNLFSMPIEYIMYFFFFVNGMNDFELQNLNLPCTSEINFFTIIFLILLNSNFFDNILFSIVKSWYCFGDSCVWIMNSCLVWIPVWYVTFPSCNVLYQVLVLRLSWHQKMT